MQEFIMLTGTPVCCKHVKAKQMCGKMQRMSDVTKKKKPLSAVFTATAHKNTSEDVKGKYVTRENTCCYKDEEHSTPVLKVDHKGLNDSS